MTGRPGNGFRAAIVKFPVIVMQRLTKAACRHAIESARRQAVRAFPGVRSTGAQTGAVAIRVDFLAAKLP